MSNRNDATALSELTEKQFRLAIDSTGSNLNRLLTPPSLDAAWNTISEIQKRSTSSSPCTSLVYPSFLSLVCSDSTGNNASSPEPISTATGEFLVELVRAANETANSNACSSVLAGQTSEADEYGDVGILLHTNAISPTNNLEKNAQAILSSLGLKGLLTSGQTQYTHGKVTDATVSHVHPLQIKPLLLSKETKLPKTIQYSPDDTSVQHLTELTTRLDHAFAFLVDCSGDGGVVFYFLVGKLRTAGESTWAGLLGAGIWTG